MNAIERRKFLFVILAIIIVGTVGLLAIWYFAAPSRNPINNNPDRQTPKFLSSIDSIDNHKFLAPMGIATDDKNVYILDSGNRHLAIYSQSEEPLKYVSLAAHTGNNLPAGITVDDQNKIYVSVIGNANKIATFDDSGRFTGVFTPKDNSARKPGQSDAAGILGRPVGLHATSGKLYVTDVMDQNIKVFDTATGKLLLQFGRPGSGDGEFLYPNGVTVADNGEIFVSDSNNTRIQVFDSKGSFLYEFRGPKNDRMALPRGLAFDNKKRLHVVDTLKQKVFVFSKPGKLLYSYGKSGGTSTTFSFPNAIAFGADFEKIYIADKQNNRAAIWKP